MQAYLDNSATTCVCGEAAEKMMELLTVHYGNPSSLHEKGMEAHRELEQARKHVAARLGCAAQELIFTSGGTESNNLALFGAAEARRRQGRRIVTSSIEHPSVSEPMKRLERDGFDVVRLPVGPDGKVREADLSKAIDAATILVSIMAVNNEVGSVQPVAAAADAIRRCGAPALLHCDAVQAFGKLSVKPAQMGVDLMTISAHKIHGPKGVGALYCRKGVRIVPRAMGGGQERVIRPGTEALPAIAGFGAAVQALPALRESFEKTAALRDYLVERGEALGGIAFNSPADALPYVTNFSVTGIRSEILLNFLSERGIYVSSGSACSKGQLSHVLPALGLSGSRVDSALRVSFSRFTTREEIDCLVDALREAQQTIRRAR